MSFIEDAVEALTAKLSTIPRLRVYSDLGASVAPPGIIIGPPSLTWRAVCAEPSEATFSVVLVVDQSDRAIPKLWELVPLVAAALDEVPDAALRSASPGVWSAGGQDLPCYEFTVDYSL